MKNGKKQRTITAGILIIGNEILSGRTQDTNVHYLTTNLGSLGIKVEEARVIPDLAHRIVNSVNEMRETYDYLFTTGGIGPTHDDITTECIAEAFGVQTFASPEISEVIKRRPAPPNVMDARLRMAKIPIGASLIDNPTGGPQGFQIENVFVMAGIPKVMQAMFSTLHEVLEKGPIIYSRSVTAHLSESQIAKSLFAVQDKYPDIDLGSYPFFRDSKYGTSLVMRGTNLTELDSILDDIKEIIIAAGEEPQDIQKY